VDDHELARLEHDNQIVALGVAAQNVPGAVIRRDDGVAVIGTGLPTRLFNRILIDGEQATAPAIKAAFDALQGISDRASIDLRVGMDDRWRPLMGRLGLERLGDRPWMPGMALHPIDVAALPAPPAGLDIRRIHGTAGLDELIAVVSDGFGPIAQAVTSPSMLDRPDVSVVVGYEDGVPVTTGMGIRTVTTVGVYMIATVETARRRGYGAAITARVIADGAAAGCDVAVLQSSDMGLGVYRAMGFRTVVEYDLYGRPAG
jgi:hypothetical protein